MEFKLSENAVKAVEEILNDIEKFGKIEKDGIVIKCDQFWIDLLLFPPKKLSSEQLIKMRNSFVIVLDDKKMNARENNDWNNFERYQTLLTIITGSIDRKLHEGKY